MRRTIQISDKYKDIIDKYEMDLSKEEFHILITKLLKVNQELENKNISIFLIYELIEKYNLDFFSLINLISNYSSNTQIEKVEINNEVINPEVYSNSPLVDLGNNTSTKSLNSKSDEKKNEKKEILKEDKEEIKKIKEIKEEEIEKNIKKEVKIKNEVVETKKEIIIEETEELYNPILSLGIDLS